MQPIYLVRHGETHFNVERRLQGSRSDAPLTGRGEDQAARVGRILINASASGPEVRLVSSPLGRARSTAAIILRTLGRPEDRYSVDDRLREIDYGDWTGRTMAAVQIDDAERWAVREADPWMVRAPNGESYADVAARALDWFRSVTEPTIAVAHGVIGRVLRGAILGLDGVAIRALPEPHDCVFRICGHSVECLREEPPK